MILLLITLAAFAAGYGVGRVRTLTQATQDFRDAKQEMKQFTNNKNR